MASWRRAQVPRRAKPFTAALMVAWLAGCAAGPVEDLAAAAGPASPSDDGRPLPWALFGCELSYALAVEGEASASQGLPPGYVVIGRGTSTAAELMLRVVECKTAVLGDNRSVVRPFRWAEIVMVIAPENDTAAPFEDRLLRELFVEDEAIAASLAAYGLPAKAAAIRLRESEEVQFRIEGEGFAYVMTGPYSLVSQAAGEREVSWRLHAMAGEAGDRHVWADQLERVPAHQAWIDTGSLQVAGGYLGQANPAGVQPAPGGFDEGIDFELTFGAPLPS